MGIEFREENMKTLALSAVILVLVGKLCFDKMIHYAGMVSGASAVNLTIPAV